MTGLGATAGPWAQLLHMVGARPAPAHNAAAPDWASDDGAILARIAAGDREALRLVFDRDGGTLFVLARALVGSPAAGEDVVVDVFRRLWATAGRLWAQGSPLRPWLAAATFEQVQRRGPAAGAPPHGDARGVAAVATVALAGAAARCDGLAARLGTSQSRLAALLRQGLHTLGDPSEP